MIRGLYTAAAGMLSTLTANDVLANNLANINTTGYKKNGVTFQSFPEMLIHKMDRNGEQAEVGSLMTGSKVRETHIDFSQGALTQTGNQLDFGIQGDGFFTLENADGEKFYSRAGEFTVNADGYLTTASGDFVMGDSGRIALSNLDPGSTVVVSGKGELTSKNRPLGTFKITHFTNNQSLVKVGDNKFAATAASKEMTDDIDYTIHQGQLERSNSNVIMEMVHSIEGTRLYEALQKNITFHNQALGKAVNEVGRYR